MPAPAHLPDCRAVLAEVNARRGTAYRCKQRLPGGEQGGAHLLADGDHRAVLTWEPAGGGADQILRAFPAVVHATDGGWPAARWLCAAALPGGGAFVLQELAPGSPVSALTEVTVRAVVSANARQRGLGLPDAVDDSSQLEAVVRGEHPWRDQVARCTAAGAALVEHGTMVTTGMGATTIPSADVVHGDYSSSNLLLDPSARTITLVDCQTVGRGSRVRDLADLYRQGFVYPSPQHTGLALLRKAAVAAEGPEVFATCVVAVTYNNLAWWAENKPRAEFDRACHRLHRLFDSLHPGP